MLDDFFAHSSEPELPRFVCAIPAFGFDPAIWPSSELSLGATAFAHVHWFWRHSSPIEALVFQVGNWSVSPARASPRPCRPASLGLPMPRTDPPAGRLCHTSGRSNSPRSSSLAAYPRMDHNPASVVQRSDGGPTCERFGSS